MIVLKNILVPTGFEGATLRTHAGDNLRRRSARPARGRTALFHARFADPAELEATAGRPLAERAAADDRQRYETDAVLEKFDSPTEAIVRYARAAAIDLIVMGTYGRSGADRLLMGSVAERGHPERGFITNADDVLTSASK